MCIFPGDLVIVSTLFPEIEGEKIGIFIEEHYSNGAHTSYLVLTLNGMEEVNSFMVFPVEKERDQLRQTRKQVRTR